MHISADLTRLQQHLDYIQNEISITERIIQTLEFQRRQNVDPLGPTEEIYLQQLRFANDMKARLRERKQLVQDILEVLSQAKHQMSRNTEDALDLLRQED